MRIADIRQEYMRAGLVEKDAAADPFKQFDRWFHDALEADLPLPNAMALATATAAGRPSARVVLLKGVDARGFVFYTNYASRKARELAANPYAALVFAWSELERQVRIEGAIEKVSAEESDAYFDSRPLGSRLGAWASPQSMVLPDRLTLATKVAAIVLRYGKHPPNVEWVNCSFRPPPCPRSSITSTASAPSIPAAGERAHADRFIEE